MKIEKVQKLAVNLHDKSICYTHKRLQARASRIRLKVNIRPIPLTINPEPGLHIKTVFIEKEKTDVSLVYPELNNQTTFCHLFESNENG